MAKTKSNRNSGGAKQAGNWSLADHDARTAKRIASLNKKRRRQQRQQGQEESDDEQQQQQQQRAPHHEQPLHQTRPKKKKGNRLALASQVPEDSYKRSHLAHDNLDQIDSSRLRLATAQLQRKVDAMKERLERWDPIAEEKLKLAIAAQQDDDNDDDEHADKSSIEYKMKIDAQNRLMDRQARTQAQSEYNLLHAKHGVNSSNNRRKANLKKKPRPGPESWKLRGAARPAWEVYDFDTRFVDVHLKAHEEANEIARRSRNVLSLCRGRFAMDGTETEGEGENNENEKGSRDTEIDKNDKNGNDQKGKEQFAPPQPQCREYLSLLTQLGSLQLARKNYSSARKSFLEAIELEGTHHPNSITNARYQLMNMYLSTNRPSSARKLWITLEKDGSAWIKYSAALIEYVSWNLLHEDGSTSETAERLLTNAIRGNVYTAYLLGWPQTFERAMEYTEEVVERGLDSKSGSILEAIQYSCGSYDGGQGNGKEDGEDEERGMGMWMGTEGSLDWVRSVVLKALTGKEGSAQQSEDQVSLTRADLLAWDVKLNKEAEDFEKERVEKEQKTQEGEYERVQDGDGNPDQKEEEEEEPDVVMFAGMFRTAMDWLQDAGEFLKEPSFDYVDEEEDAAGDDSDNEMVSNIKEGGEKEESNADSSDSEDDSSSESGTERGPGSKEEDEEIIIIRQQQVKDSGTENDDDDDESTSSSSASE